MFRKHTLRVESEDFDQGETVALFTMRASDFGITGTTDTESGTTDNLSSPLSGNISPNERYCVAKGPVTIHGYSLRAHGNFLGGLFQGLGSWDSDYLTDDKNAIGTHMWHSALTQNTASSSDMDEETRIKNFTYLRGWSAEVKWKDDGSIWNPLDTSIVAGGISQTLGYAHLQKKFSRKKLKHIGGGKYKKLSKSGFVLVPNTPTEYFTLNIKNIAPNLDNRTFQTDLSVWYSYDES